MADLEHEFWRPDRKRFQRSTPFAKLSPERKICLVMLCCFTLLWCFYLGIAIAGASAPPWEGYRITGDDFLPFDEDILLADVDHDGMQITLVVGCDKRPDDIGRTDTIILAFVDTETGEAKVLSIPRDTYVTIPGGGKTKINHAYAFGGITLTKATIESAFGIKVDNYVEMDFNGFIELVDALGGVDIDVPERMYNSLENINLQAGPQRLNGAKALQFVRFREPIQADIGRIQRQQQFLSALMDEVATPSVILKIPKLVEVGLKNVETDLSAKEIMALANLVLKTDLSALELITLPGEGKYINRVSYWVMEEKETEALVRYLMGEEKSADSAGSEEPGEPE